MKFFYQKDAFTLINILTNLNIDWRKSLIEPLGKSNAQVYRVLYGDGKIINLSKPEVDICIKISNGEKSHASEVTSLKLLSEYYTKNKDNYYALFHFSNGIPVHFPMNQSPLKMDEKAAEKPGKSDFSLFTASLDRIMTLFTDSKQDLYNAIGMRVGDEAMINIVNNREMTLKMYREVIESIKAIHHNKRIHTDIRPCNILYFRSLDRFFVIDFDLSCPIGSDVILSKKSARAKMAPLVVRDKIAKSKDEFVKFRWIAGYDMLMFSEYFLPIHGQCIFEY